MGRFLINSLGRKIKDSGLTSPPFHFKNWKYIRLSILMGLDALLISLSYWCAFYLRLENAFFTRHFFAPFLHTLPIFLVANLAAFVFWGMYRQVWRYANFNSAVLIAKCIGTGTIISVVIYYSLEAVASPPRSIPIIFALLAMMTITLSKFSWRAWTTFLSSVDSESNRDRCLIYGAGGAGELFARHIAANPNFPLRAVGFIDDDRNKRGRILHGIKILGSGDDLARFVRQYDVKTVVLALHSAKGSVIRGIVEKCQKVKVSPLIMPEMSSALSTEVIQPRRVDVRDLLRRAPATINQDRIRGVIARKSVLVTGAGGSIGSEICRQIVEFGPTKIILLDASEYNLYRIDAELRDSGLGEIELVSVLGSAAKKTLVERVFRDHSPQIVLHAAAYKHVPLLEANICEGVINNVVATKVLCESAVHFGSERFLLVSSDKAVKPTNAMGASKRCCEMLVQAFHKQAQSTCKFSAVRFGNVLGSSGSVVPRFMEQIQKGGPVTVTDREITRFFMLTSEAVALVLQSVSMSNGGEIFVLNMGEPVKIYEMAKQLILLAGKDPEKDIDIVFTGLRPGEKLYEELLLEGSETHTMHEDVFVALPDRSDAATTVRLVDELIESAERGDDAKARSLVFQVIKGDFRQTKSMSCRESKSPETAVHH